MTATDDRMAALTAVEDAIAGIRQGDDPATYLDALVTVREGLRSSMGLPIERVSSATRRQVVARRIQRAVERMPYPWVLGVEVFAGYGVENGSLRVRTLREFFETTWQGPHADAVFREASLVAADAVLMRKGG